MNFRPSTFSRPLPPLTARRNHCREHVGILAVVEAEGKLVQVQGQIRLADIVIGANDAALYKTPKAFDAIGMDLAAYPFILAMVNGFVRKATMDVVVSLILVRSDQANLIAGYFIHETGKGRRVHSADDASHHVALASDGPDYANLGETLGFSGLPQIGAFLSLVPVAVLAADVGFINLDHTVQLVHLAAHGRAPALTDIPACVVVVGRFLAKDDPMNLKGRDALFRGQHQISDLEPDIQGHLGILKDGAGQDAEPIAVLSAAYLADPMPRLEVQFIDAGILAASALNAIRPAHIDQELLAIFFAGELLIKFAYGLHALKYIATIRWGVNIHLLPI